jgi:hypothetical protein
MESKYDQLMDSIPGLKDDVREQSVGIFETYLGEEL